MATNKTERDMMVVIAVVVAFCVTILANLLADNKFARIDLTREGRYSLSKPFLNILSHLDDTCKLTYYVSDKPPAGFERYKRDMLDKLREIETASKGKIKVVAIDPTNNKELRERLIKEGFQHEIMVQEKDQAVQALIFSGLEITYQDKPTIPIPQIWQAEFLEYVIGSSVVELTQTKKPIIAVHAPPSQQPMMPGRQAPGSGFEWIAQGLWDSEKKFDIRSVELSENNTIPPETSLFILIRPKNLSERQKYEIAKYLAGGGRMLLMASSFNVSYEFGWRAERTPTGLEDYLKGLGLTMGQDFVADNANLKIPVENAFTREVEFKGAPLFIHILPENIDQEQVITRLLPGMLVLSPSAISLDKATLQKNNLKESILATTSKQTWIIPYAEGIDLSKETNYDAEKQPYDGPRNVFVMLEGQFPFPYEGKPAPAWEKNGPPPAEVKDKKEDAPLVKKPGWLAVFSGPEAFHSLYMNSRDLGQFMQGNMLAIRNIADNFSMGDDLIRLRTKQYETRTIKALGGSQNDFKRTALKVAMIGGPAALLFIFALVWFIWRRAAQTRYERSFAQTIGPSSFTS